MDIWEEMYEKAKREYHPEDVSPFIRAHHVVAAVQSESGKIDDKTSYVFFPIDGFKGFNDENVREAQKELESILKNTFNCETVSGFVDKDNPVFEWFL